MKNLKMKKNFTMKKNFKMKKLRKRKQHCTLWVNFFTKKKLSSFFLRYKPSFSENQASDEGEEIKELEPKIESEEVSVFVFLVFFLFSYRFCEVEFK